MLTALTDLDHAEANIVLAQAARLVLGGTARSGSERAQRIVAELRQREEQHAQSEEQLAQRVTEALSREISEYALAGVNLTEIRANLGQKGFLPTGLYQVNFTPHFQRQRSLFSVRPAHVLNAISEPTSVQHLSPRLTSSNGFAVSLFLQTPRVNGPPYTLLIKCNRVSAELNVEDALYLFHDAFDLSRENTPIQALRQFLGRFGIPVEAAGHIGNPLEQLIITFPEDGRVEFRMSNGLLMGTLSGTPGEEFDHLLTYAFDQVPYSKYLERYGKASRPVGNVWTLSTSAILNIQPGVAGL